MIDNKEFYHIFDEDVELVYNFKNYTDMEQLRKALYKYYGFVSIITATSTVEDICEILNYTIETTKNEI